MPEDPASSAAAVAAAVVGRFGLRSDDPVVLRDAWHVLVHLRPLPIVARVSSAQLVPGGPSRVQVIRELEVAGHAARAGAPVIAPSDLVDPGPHRLDGRVVSLWRYVPQRGEADPASAGRALRVVHETLEDFDRALPPFGHPGDVDAMLASAEPSADVELLRRIVARRPVVDGQALHGDAHRENCLASPSGVLWHDFETACRGPREYDLAALVLGDRWDGTESAASRAALAAYGTHDADLLERVVPVYAAWICASYLLVLPRRPEVAPSLRRRLDRLRDLAGET
jgi:Ser/Thr protein kinase RdoA (MazF antagonist)